MTETFDPSIPLDERIRQIAGHILRERPIAARQLSAIADEMRTRTLSAPSVAGGSLAEPSPLEGSEPAAVGAVIPSKHVGAEAHFGRLFCDGAYGEAQYYVKQRDYESLRRRFEKACARITELESAQVETPAERPLVYTPCALHMGQWFTMTVGIGPTPRAVCPICNPPDALHPKTPVAHGEPQQ